MVGTVHVLHDIVLEDGIDPSGKYVIRPVFVSSTGEITSKIWNSYEGVFLCSHEYEEMSLIDYLENKSSEQALCKECRAATRKEGQRDDDDDDDDDEILIGRRALDSIASELSSDIASWMKRLSPGKEGEGGFPFSKILKQFTPIASEIMKQIESSAERVLAFLSIATQIVDLMFVIQRGEPTGEPTGEPISVWARFQLQFFYDNFVYEGLKEWRKKNPSKQIAETKLTREQNKTVKKTIKYLGEITKKEKVFWEGDIRGLIDKILEKSGVRIKPNGTIVITKKGMTADEAKIRLKILYWFATVTMTRIWKNSSYEGLVRDFVERRVEKEEQE